MNPKQAVPLAVTFAPLLAAAPPVLIIGGIVALAAWVLSDDKKNKPDAAPDAENSRKPAETPILREIPAILPVIIPRPVHSILADSASIPPGKLSAKSKKPITRADMVKIFKNGQLSLTRMDAVSALKQLGYGKTAAYSATAPDGRFSEWLIFGSDGIISWAE